MSNIILSTVVDKIVSRKAFKNWLNSSLPQSNNVYIVESFIKARFQASSVILGVDTVILKYRKKEFLIKPIPEWITDYVKNNSELTEMPKNT